MSALQYRWGLLSWVNRYPKVVLYIVSGWWWYGRRDDVILNTCPFGRRHNNTSLSLGFEHILNYMYW